MTSCCFFEREFPELAEAIVSLRQKDQTFLSKLKLYNEIRLEIQHIGEDHPLKIEELASQNESLLTLQENLIHRIAAHMQLNKS